MILTTPYKCRKTQKTLSLHNFMCAVIVFLSSITYSFAQDESESKPNSVEHLVILANKNVGRISVDETKVLYSLKQKFLANSNRALLVGLPIDNPATLKFSRELYGLYPYQLQRVWDKFVFSGRGKAPKVINNMKEMVNYISDNENTIGYALIKPSDIETLEEAVYVLSIK